MGKQQTNRPQVKICGLRDLATAQTAAGLGADFVGFVFYPASRRHIAPEAAAAISAALPDVKKVGVFVDAPVAEVNGIASLCRLDFVQLHGHEDSAYARQMERPVIKAFRWGDDFSVAAANEYPAAYILLDSFAKGFFGGTGQTFAWQEAAALTARLAKPFFVAGGLNAANVASAASIFHPFGVDVSGGVEDGGKKSPQKIRELLQTVAKIKSS